MSQEFVNAGQDESVIEGLYAIEDKLMETGKLTTLTGDNTAEISIRYEFTKPPDGSPEGKYLAVRITAEVEANEVEVDLAEEMRDYISEKLDDLLESIDEEIAEKLYESDGELIIVNGHIVY